MRDKPWRRDAQYTSPVAAGVLRSYVFDMATMFNLLIPAAMLIVFGTLCAGVYALFRGGDFGRTWSNRLMRMRVVTQFVAVLVLLAALLWKQSFGG